jgi:hypothetical protein
MYNCITENKSKQSVNTFPHSPRDQGLKMQEAALIAMVCLKHEAKGETNVSKVTFTTLPSKMYGCTW